MLNLNNKLTNHSTYIVFTLRSCHICNLCIIFPNAEAATHCLNEEGSSLAVRQRMVPKLYKLIREGLLAHRWQDVLTVLIALVNEGEGTASSIFRVSKS